MPRKIRCAVDAITDHGGRVYTIDLKPQSPVPLFLPGQFLHLTVDDYDPASFWPESRVFSIASSPRERSLIRVCYSVKGRYTEKMERMLKAGGDVWIKLPYGEFVIDNTRDAVLIAGGTGISAFTAFIEALVPVQPTSNSLLKDSLHPPVAAPDKAWPDDLRAFSRDGHRLSAAATVFHGADSPSTEGQGVGSSPASPAPRVTLLYGARTPDLWLFRDMIERQAAACPQFSALFFAESGPLPDSSVSAGVDRALPLSPLAQRARLQKASVVALRPPVLDLPGTPESRTRAQADDLDSPPSALCPLTSDVCPRSSVRYLSGRLSLDLLFIAPGPCASNPDASRPSTAHGPPSAVPAQLTSDLRPLISDFCPLPPVFYLSGPPAMLSVFGGELQARGIPPDQIRTDAWE